MADQSMSALIRLKLFLFSYGRIAAICFCLLGIVAVAGGAFVFTNPPVEDVTEEVDVEQVSTSVLTSAVVANNTTLYEPGERLVNQPVYVMAATPELTVRIQTRVPEGREVMVTQQLTLRHAASRNDRVFWESNRVLVDDRVVVEDGQAISSETVNVTAIAEEARQRQSQLGEIGLFTTEIVLNVTYDTGRYEGRLTGTTPLSLTERAYWLDNDIARSQTHSRSVTQSVVRPPDRLLAYGLFALGVSSFITAILFVHLRRQDIDIAELEMELEVLRYDEWISEGQVVTDSDRDYVKIASLEDLVDIAIDSEKRVICDTEFPIYAIVDDDVVYYFATDTFQVDDWLTM